MRGKLASLAQAAEFVARQSRPSYEAGSRELSARSLTDLGRRCGSSATAGNCGGS